MLYRYECAVCGRSTAGRKRKGEPVLFPRKHWLPDGSPCPGNKKLAIHIPDRKTTIVEFLGDVHRRTREADEQYQVGNPNHGTLGPNEFFSYWPRWPKVWRKDCKNPVALFVYALTCPIETTTFYVGLTNGPFRRYRGHINAPRGTSKDKIIWLRSHGRLPWMDILEVVTSGKQSYGEKREAFWIRQLVRDGCPLVNKQAARARAG